MSTTTRRKGKAKYDKDALLHPPALVVEAAKRSSNPTTRLVTAFAWYACSHHINRIFRLRWTIPVTMLALLVVYFYYASIPQKFNSWPRHSAVPPQPDADDHFVIVDLPGRGKGMLATRDFEASVSNVFREWSLLKTDFISQQGERIITENPAFVTPSHSKNGRNYSEDAFQKSIINVYLASGSPSSVIAKLLREASPKDRDAVLNLSYVHFPENLDPETHPDEVALAIFQTNAVAVREGVGIFPRMARLNHGCSGAFNAVYTWRDKEGVLVVHALKKILKGQLNVGENRAFLEENYDFTCMCRVCSLTDRESRASDTRLMAIADGYAQFATWGQGAISGIEAIDVVRMIWAIEDEEGYWSERGQLAADAAWVAAAHSE
ncbi:hypothetical protein C0991_003329 [Blastosporella zonata]|nr:hypothetical protein C0991_003329 [Blastosporella zonata]